MKPSFSHVFSVLPMKVNNRRSVASRMGITARWRFEFGGQVSVTDIYHTIPYHTIPYHTMVVVVVVAMVEFVVILGVVVEVVVIAVVLAVMVWSCSKLM